MAIVAFNILENEKIINKVTLYIAYFGMIYCDFCLEMEVK